MSTKKQLNIIVNNEVEHKVGSVAALSLGPVSAVTFASWWRGWTGLGWAGWCRYLQETRSSAEHCSILEWRPLPAGLTLGGESHSTAADGWSPHCSGLTSPCSYGGSGILPSKIQ